MSTEPPTVLSFAVRDGARLVCVRCRSPWPAHTESCPVLAMNDQLRALTSNVGLFVADIHETLEAIRRLIQHPPATPPL